jgi:hypothetical protein
MAEEAPQRALHYTHSSWLNWRITRGVKAWFAHIDSFIAGYN